MPCFDFFRVPEPGSFDLVGGCRGCASGDVARPGQLLDFDMLTYFAGCPQLLSCGQCECAEVGGHDFLSSRASRVSRVSAQMLTASPMVIATGCAPR